VPLLTNVDDMVQRRLAALTTSGQVCSRHKFEPKPQMPSYRSLHRVQSTHQVVHRGPVTDSVVTPCYWAGNSNEAGAPAVFMTRSLASELSLHVARPRPRRSVQSMHILCFGT